MTFVFLNAGVPMIFPSMILMIVVLIPIILLEAVCLQSSLGVNFWNALKSSAVANIFSTFIGISLVWIFLIFVKYLIDGSRVYYLKPQPPLIKVLLFICESPWMFPRGNTFNWTIYASGLILLVPFFFASWFSEHWIVAYFLADATTSIEANKTVRNANLLSYLGLAAYALFLLVREQRRLWKALSRKSRRTRQKPKVTNQQPTIFFC